MSESHPLGSPGQNCSEVNGELASLPPQPHQENTLVEGQEKDECWPGLARPSYDQIEGPESSRVLCTSPPVLPRIDTGSPIGLRPCRRTVVDEPSHSFESHYSDESEIVTPLDLRALRQLSQGLQIEMAEVKKEQAQNYLSKENSAEKQPKQIAKIMEHCDNVKTLYRGSPPYSPVDYRPRASTMADTKVDDIQPVETIRTRSSLDIPLITDKDLPSPPKHNKSPRHMKSFARLRRALGRNANGPGDCGAKAEEYREPETIKRGYSKATPKEQSFPKFKKVLLARKHRDDTSINSRTSTPGTDVSSVNQTTSEFSGHSQIDQARTDKVDPDSSLSVSRAVSGSPVHPQLSQLRIDNTSVESSSSSEYFDTMNVRISYDSASSRSHQGETSLEDKTLVVPANAKDDMPVVAPPAPSINDQVVIDKSKAYNTHKNRVYTAMKARHTPGLNGPLQTLPQRRTPNTKKKVSNKPLKSPHQEVYTPMRERSDSRSSINSSNYSGNESSVHTARIFRIDNIDSDAHKTARARMEGY